MTDEEKGLLERLAAGEFDGPVGDSIETSGKSTVWKEIINGIPTMFKQGPTRRYFDNRETVKSPGVKHTLQTWESEEEKIEFFRKFGWLIDDEDMKDYSAIFKPKK